MSFKAIYRDALSGQGYHSDAGQATVVEHLERLCAGIQRHATGKTFYNDLWRALRGATIGVPAAKGCYLWGGVGRGKTWLMDLFFQAAPSSHKMRFHFHEFMQGIHTLLEQYQGRKDPLRWVAWHMTRQARLFCLDEFHVSDITDAMLLSGLLEAMYRFGAVFVMTSNVPPDELYKNGLQRSQFLPAIDLLKQNNHVVLLDGEVDYRLHSDNDNHNYFCPLSSDTDTRLEQRFRGQAQGKVSINQTLTVNRRAISTRLVADNIAWFEFDAICGGPRAASDYIVLAQRYEQVIISNIFRMDDINDDIAKRFIDLVDAFYDRKTFLIVSATAWPQDLYLGRRFALEFARTASRLEQMRSSNRVRSTLRARG